MMVPGVQVFVSTAVCLAAVRASALFVPALRGRTRVLGLSVVMCLSVAVFWYALGLGGLAVGSLSSSALYAALATAVLSLMLDASSGRAVWALARMRYAFLPAVFALVAMLAQFAVQGSAPTVVWSVWFVAQLALFWSAFAVALWGSVAAIGWLSQQADPDDADSGLRILGSVLGLLSLSLVFSAFATFVQLGQWWVWSQARTMSMVVAVALLAVLHAVRAGRASAGALAWVLLVVGGALLVAAVVWSGAAALSVKTASAAMMIDGICG